MANARRDENSIPTLTGVSNVDGVTPVNVYVDPITHRLIVDASSSIGTFIDSEVVSGSGTSWTLANLPIVGSVHLFGAGIRLTPGAGNDYTISGVTVTTANSYSTGSLLADYRK